jgi:3-oxoacyl-[acyl-carrier protein] reductase
MDLGLSDKVAIVLASSDGLGCAAAEALAREGARVAISGRDRARLEAARARIAASAGATDRVHARPLDVLDSAALVAYLADVRALWGSVDVLVTNAGGPRPGTAAEVGDEDLERAFDLTLRSALVAIRTVVPWMRERRWGRIIALTSISVRQPIPGLALSNTMRAGLTGWLKTLSLEVAGEGVLVNSVCSGLFDTERLRELFEVRAQRSGRNPQEERRLAELEIPLGRIGRPDELGAVVAFLASERASFLNGVALACDGGGTRGLY